MVWGVVRKLFLSGLCSLQISVSPHSDIYYLIVDEEGRGLLEVEMVECSRSGFSTVIKSPPKMMCEFWKLASSANREWKNVAESAFGP